MKTIFALGLVLAGGLFCAAGPDDPVATEQAVELGLVQWNRNLEDALALSAESGKPIFVLFQEVPG